MPEIDLPTVIFALVALFVAYKLRSVLGVRNNSERQPGGLLARCAACRAPSIPPSSQPEGAASVPRSAARRRSLEGRRRTRPCGLERPRRRRRGGSRLLAPGLSFRRRGPPTTWSFMLSPPAIPRPCAI